MRMCTQVVPEDIKGGDVVEAEANPIGAQRFPASAFVGGQVFHPMPVGQARPCGFRPLLYKPAIQGFDSGADRF